MYNCFAGGGGGGVSAYPFSFYDFVLKTECSKIVKLVVELK